MGSRGGGTGRARGGGFAGRGGRGQMWSPVQRPSSDRPDLPVQQLDPHPVNQPPPPTIAPASVNSSARGRGQVWSQVQQPSSDRPDLPVQRPGPHQVKQPPPPTIAPASVNSSARGKGQVWSQVQRPSSDRPDLPVQRPGPHQVKQPPPPTVTPASVNSSACSSHTREADNKLKPIRRPDKGGSNAIRKILLRVNHFLVRFKSDGMIMHYDVDIKPEVPPKKGSLARISKSTLNMIKDKLCADYPSQFPALSFGYDGEKNIFSAVELPTGKFKVTLSQEEEMKVCSFIVTINLVKQLELQKLSDYLSGKILDVPRDILQGMDVAVKENPARCMISVGRSFYSSQISREDELGCGIVASKGFQHSLKACAQGVNVCMDYSVVPFLKPIPVLEFLKEHVLGFTPQKFKAYRHKVEAVLRGLKVRVIHRQTGQKFTIAGLSSQETRVLSFLILDPEGKKSPKKVMLVDYFKERYDVNILNKDIPCLDLGKNNRSNYVPMEFCSVVEGQRYPKEKLDRNAAQRLREESLPPPYAREKKICEMIQASNGPCGGGIIDHFGIDVKKEMTTVSGRIIQPPELKLGGPSTGKVSKITVDKDKCHWNLVGKCVVKGIPVDRWAVIDFSAKDQYNRLDPNKFIPRFIGRCRSIGIQMHEPRFYKTANMNVFSDFHMLRALLEEINGAGQQLQILMCVMAGRHPGYSYLKWFSETKIGMITQCCLSGPANKVSDQYLANLAIKMNAKLGGSNVELIERLPRFETEGGHVMFIGADVNHPGSRNMTSPSIAAVVATMNWPAANRYAARICPQAHRVEKIQNFGGMCLELIENYARENKVKPEKIVVFRDGVSEGQFDMALNEELLDLKRALQGENYHPTITLIVARKRHLTRFFPESNGSAHQGDRSFNGNVPPGTVVDTMVVHLSQFDFYLCSHYGMLGTSKPTHYHVLYDEHKFSSDQLQKLIYNLCFTFARCTKPVSLVPPVYYADLAAYRGRLYYDAMVAEAEALPQRSSSLSSSSSLSAEVWLNQSSYRLHDTLENMMFFI